MELHREGGRPPRAAWAAAVLAVLVGVAAGLPAVVERIRGERPSRRPVELALDWRALKEAAARWGAEPEDALVVLARAGVTTLALTERTVGELADGGEALVLAPWLAPVAGVPVRAPAGTGSVLVLPGREPLALPDNPAQARLYGAGFDPEGLEAAARAGVAVLMRPGPAPGLAALGGEARLPPGLRESRVMLFAGARVPPPDRLPGRLLGPGRQALGLVEFASQPGAPRLARLLGLRAVRVHSIAQEEMEGLGPGPASARYLRAVRERGVGLLYLRPAADLDGTEAMVRQVRRGLERAGHPIGLAEPLPLLAGPGPLQAGLAALGVAGLGVLGALTWHGARRAVAPGGWGSPGGGVAQPPAPLWTGAGLVGLTAAAALGALAGAAQLSGWDGPLAVRVRQGLALAAALLGPVAALGAALAACHAAGCSPSRPGRGAALASGMLAGAAAFAAVTLASGLLVAGLLSDSLFMLRLEVFRGVKVAHALPPVGAGLAALWAAGRGPQAWRGWLLRPVRWLDAAAAGAFVGLAAYYLARTGNELAPVTALEELARGWLETALGVRPRTKEWLVGYPGLALALWLWGRGLAGRLPAGLAAACAAASVASVSVINSWAHIHTPVAVTAERVANGWLVGAFTGLLAMAAAAVLGRLVQTHAPAEGESAAEGRPVRVLRVR